MADFLERKERNVIPQWRPFHQTVLAQNGETSSLTPWRSKPVPTLSEQPVRIAQQEFSRTPSSWFATDLLAAAATAGHETVATEAAQFILQDLAALPAARGLAASYLGVEETPPPLQCHERREMRNARRILHLYPHDAIAWTDLCYGLVVAGKFEAAQRAMAVALQLAPESRFILRAAARLYVHIGDYERALSVLRSSPRTSMDPWLAAAEIATSRYAKLPSLFVRQGRTLMKGDFSARQVTELASALGTIEYYAAGRKSKSTALRLLSRSLEDPNVNSLAQATWFRLVLDSRMKRVALTRWDRGFEAKALEEFAALNIPRLLDHTEQWFDDQPVAERAAEIFGWAATSLTVGQTERAIAMNKRATTTNPNSAILWNNLAFSLLLKERVDEAAVALRRGFRTESRDALQEAALTATRGMLRFRQGDADQGRMDYYSAIKQVIDNRLDLRILANAFLNLAREEAIAGTDIAVETLRQAIDTVNRAPRRHDTGPMTVTALKRIAGIRPSHRTPIPSPAVAYAASVLNNVGGGSTLPPSIIVSSR